MKRSEILAEFELVAARKIAHTTEQSYRVWIVKYIQILGKRLERAGTQFANAE